MSDRRFNGGADANRGCVNGGAYVDIYVCLYLAFYVKINQYRTEDNCVHMSYHPVIYQGCSHNRPVLFVKNRL